MYGLPYRWSHSAVYTVTNSSLEPTIFMYREQDGVDVLSHFLGLTEQMWSVVVLCGRSIREIVIK